MLISLQKNMISALMCKTHLAQFTWTRNGNNKMFYQNFRWTVFHNDSERASGSGWTHCAMELPSCPDSGKVGSRFCCWMHHSSEACRADPPHCLAHGSTHQGGTLYSYRVILTFNIIESWICTKYFYKRYFHLSWHRYVFSI